VSLTSRTHTIRFRSKEQLFQLSRSFNSQVKREQPTELPATKFDKQITKKNK